MAIEVPHGYNPLTMHADVEYMFHWAKINEDDDPVEWVEHGWDYTQNNTWRKLRKQYKFPVYNPLKVIDSLSQLIPPFHLSKKILLQTIIIILHSLLLYATQKIILFLVILTPNQSILIILFLITFSKIKTFYILMLNKLNNINIPNVNIKFFSYCCYCSSTRFHSIQIIHHRSFLQTYQARPKF